ncbi:hypothetical protein [Streptomyces sp. KHY 26]|uniref:hypothetical protein n=1 Tax=Streptomyces sp. KHY 26 TaxID=3097359 RepID=UPI00376EFE78
MRTTTAGAVIAAALVLTGCSTDQPTAAELARKACGTIGTTGHTTSVPTGTGISPSDAGPFADSINQSADLAAKAAVQDARWNDLADAYSAMASQAAQIKAITAQTGQPALAPDQTAWGVATDTIYSECRKANVAN